MEQLLTIVTVFGLILGLMNFSIMFKLGKQILALEAENARLKGTVTPIDIAASGGIIGGVRAQKPVTDNNNTTKG